MYLLLCIFLVNSLVSTAVAMNANISSNAPRNPSTLRSLCLDVFLEVNPDEYRLQQPEDYEEIKQNIEQRYTELAEAAGIASLNHESLKERFNKNLLYALCHAANLPFFHMEQPSLRYGWRYPLNNEHYVYCFFAQDKLRNGCQQVAVGTETTKEKKAAPTLWANSVCTSDGEIIAISDSKNKSPQPVASSTTLEQSSQAASSNSVLGALPQHACSYSFSQEDTKVVFKKLLQLPEPLYSTSNIAVSRSDTTQHLFIENEGRLLQYQRPLLSSSAKETIAWRLVKDFGKILSAPIFKIEVVKGKGILIFHGCTATDTTTHTYLPFTDPTGTTTYPLYSRFKSVGGSNISRLQELIINHTIANQTEPTIAIIDDKDIVILDTSSAPTIIRRIPFPPLEESTSARLTEFRENELKLIIQRPHEYSLCALNIDSNNYLSVSSPTPGVSLRTEFPYPFILYLAGLQVEYQKKLEKAHFWAEFEQEASPSSDLSTGLSIDLSGLQ